MRIAKAHGIGNDFLLVALEDAPGDRGPWARRLCDRHRGVGADGVVLYSLEAPGARMALLNSDGSPAEISGNGLRCLSAFLVRQERLPPSHVILTGAGPRAVEVRGLAGSRFDVTAELGVPILASDRIPLSLDPPRSEVLEHEVEVLGERFRITALSFGNPHCVLFTPAPPPDAVLFRIGRALETHPLFPRGTNVEFVTVVSPSEVSLRIWERGVGHTQASGTGSASAAVAGMLTGRCGRAVKVRCEGGDLTVRWDEGESVRQTGEAEILFEGDWLP